VARAASYCGPQQEYQPHVSPDTKAICAQQPRMNMAEPIASRP